MVDSIFLKKFWILEKLITAINRQAFLVQLIAMDNLSLIYF